MNSAVYDIVSIAARYWFVFLIVYILYRTIQNARIEYKIEKSERKDSNVYSEETKSEETDEKANDESDDEEYYPLLIVNAINGVKTKQQDEYGLLGYKYMLEEFNLVGRSRKSNIYLPYDTVSGKHAQITLKGDSCFIEDLSSKNGTFVNGEEINKKSLLMPGDKIQIGDVELIYDLEKKA